MNLYSNSINAYPPVPGYMPNQQMRGYMAPQMQSYGAAAPMTAYAPPGVGGPIMQPQIQMLSNDAAGMTLPTSYDIYRGVAPREGGGMGSTIIKSLADVGKAYFDKQKADKEKAEAERLKREAEERARQQNGSGEVVGATVNPV